MSRNRPLHHVGNRHFQPIDRKFGVEDHSRLPAVLRPELSCEEPHSRRWLCPDGASPLPDERQLVQLQ